MFEYIDKILNLITAFISIILLVSGKELINKLNEKRFDSAFTYLARLNVIFSEIKTLMEVNKEDILNALTEGINRTPDASRLALVNENIERLRVLAKESINYLKNAENQYPAGKEWTEELNKFISTMLIIEKIGLNNFYIWRREIDEKEKQCAYKSYIDNIIKLISLIQMSQNYNQMNYLDRMFFDVKRFVIRKEGES